MTPRVVTATALEAVCLLTLLQNYIYGRFGCVTARGITNPLALMQGCPRAHNAYPCNVIVWLE